MGDFNRCLQMCLHIHKYFKVNGCHCKVFKGLRPSRKSASLSHIMTGKQGSLYQYKHRAWVIGEIIDFPFMILLESGDEKRQCCSKRFYTWWL